MPAQDGGLNREICAQDGALSILSLYEAKGTMFNDMNFVTAFHRIAKGRDLHSIAEKPSFNSFIEQLKSRVPGLQPHHLTNTAWALAKLALRDFQFLDAIA